jgi:hypothetical protein
VQTQPAQIQQQVYYLFSQKRISTRSVCNCNRVQLISAGAIIITLIDEHVNACNSLPTSVVGLQQIINHPSFSDKQSIIYAYINI